MSEQFHRAEECDLDAVSFVRVLFAPARDNCHKTSCTFASRCFTVFWLFLVIFPCMWRALEMKCSSVLARPVCTHMDK